MVLGRGEEERKEKNENKNEREEVAFNFFSSCVEGGGQEGGREGKWWVGR